MTKLAKNSLVCDQGDGTDPEALGLAFPHQGPTFINTYCQDATNLFE